MDLVLLFRCLIWLCRKCGGDSAQRGRCQTFLPGSLVGIMALKTQSGLVEEYRHLHSAHRGSHSLARQRLSDFPATADLLLTLHALFHRFPFDQTRSVGVGQYQGALLLVACFSSSRSAAPGAPLAEASNV